MYLYRLVCVYRYHILYPVSNACNSVNDMIFVHGLVLIIQVLMYSLRGFCQLPGWLPNWSRPCTIMGFEVATESALRPRVYLRAFTHFLQRGVCSDRQVF